MNTDTNTPDKTGGQALTMTGASIDECWPLVRDFHYSKRLPSNIQHCFAWRKEGGLFGDTGEPSCVCIYGVPVSRGWDSSILELQRLVRHDDLKKQISQFLSWSIRWLKANTSTPFLISYADSGEGHHGGIYQATNWAYVGERKPRLKGFRTQHGEFLHCKTCNNRYGTSSLSKTLEREPDWTPVYCEAKFLYVYPLKEKLCDILKSYDWDLLPYPKTNTRKALSNSEGT